MTGQELNRESSLVGKIEEQRASSENGDFCAGITLFPGPFSVFQEYVYPDPDSGTKESCVIQLPTRLGIEHRESRNKGVFYVAPREQNKFLLYDSGDQRKIRESDLCALVETEYFPVIVEENNDDGHPARRVVHLYAGKPVTNRRPQERRIYPSLGEVEGPAEVSLRAGTPGWVWARRMLDPKNRKKIGREDLSLWHQLYRGRHSEYTVVQLGWQDHGVIIATENDLLFAYTEEQRQQLQDTKIDCLAVLQEVVAVTSGISLIPYFPGKKGLVRSIYGIPLKKR